MQHWTTPQIAQALTDAANAWCQNTEPTPITEWARRELSGPGRHRDSTRSAIMLGATPRGVALGRTPSSWRQGLLFVALRQLYPRSPSRSQFFHFDGVVRPECTRGCRPEGDPLDSACFGLHGHAVDAIVEHENSHLLISSHLAWFAQLRAPLKLLVMPDVDERRRRIRHSSLVELQQDASSGIAEFFNRVDHRDFHNEQWVVVVYLWEQLADELKAGHVTDSVWRVDQVI